MRGAIFDLDGTLIDSLDDITSAVNVALQQKNFAPVDAARVRRSIGDGMPVLCERVAPSATPEQVASLCTAVANEYRRCCLDRTHLYAGIAELLDALGQAGIAMAVLSNKPDEFTRTIVAALCVKPWFAVVRGVERESDRKPAPHLALEIARELGVAPHAIALIGDSVVDIETARAAGMRSVAVTWGFRDAQELRHAGPDDVVGTPREIATLIRAV